MQFNCPKWVKQLQTSLAWYNTTVTAGQDETIACYTHLIGECGKTKSNQTKRSQEGTLVLE